MATLSLLLFSTFITFLYVFSILSNSSTLGVDYISNILQIQERERLPDSTQVAAARGLLRRLVPSHSSTFEFQIITKEQCGGESCFIISNHHLSRKHNGPEILISGVTGVELAAGLHWYLKHFCWAHVSWDKTGGVQLSLPKLGSLPRVGDAGVLIQRPVPWNYYQNAVTSSYTFAWWDWERWEKEIDWMALQGINLPLAFTGQEAIWQKVYQEKFNISSADLDDFYGGPAFLAWSRMGNLHGWGGPLPQSWLDQQLNMQKKILARMYEFGMTPVLPAFSGNVPAALKSIFPSAKIARLGNWFTVESNPKWCCTFLLDATDPLFVEIGKAFVQQQFKEYGRTSHIYNCDTFDENTPPDDDPAYISSLGAATFKGMQSGDASAIWLMQGWLFTYDPYWRPPQMKALLHSVPVGKLVVLDLFAEVKPVWLTSQQFYGIPYIWKVCMLHNFAGNVEMYGVLDALGSGPVESRLSDNSTMVGIGMSMEGIEQNPVVYDLMGEMAFEHNKVDIEKWVKTYTIRRYGKFVPSMQNAWNILYHTLYNCTDGNMDKNRDVIVSFPDVDPSSIFMQVSIEQNVLSNSKPLSGKGFLKNLADDSYDHPHLWYSISEVVNALELFIEGGHLISGSTTYRYDLIDLTRQALAKYANQLFMKTVKAYQSKDLFVVSKYSQEFLELVDDMDTLLACHDGFLLGPWLASAKQLAQNEEQKKQFEWNARTQITMWFDNTEEKASLLRDYGNKYWAGLLRDYYGPRAAIYFKYMIQSLTKGEGFQLKEWRKEWIKLTNDWQDSRNVYSVKSNGDALTLSKWLYDKYLNDAGKYDVSSM